MARANQPEECLAKESSFKHPAPFPIPLPFIPLPQPWDRAGNSESSGESLSAESAVSIPLPYIPLPTSQFPASAMGLGLVRLSDGTELTANAALSAESLSVESEAAIPLTNIPLPRPPNSASHPGSSGASPHHHDGASVPASPLRRSGARLGANPGAGAFLARRRACAALRTMGKTASRRIISAVSGGMCRLNV